MMFLPFLRMLFAHRCFRRCAQGKMEECRRCREEAQSRWEVAIHTDTFTEFAHSYFTHVLRFFFPYIAGNDAQQYLKHADTWDSVVQTFLQEAEHVAYASSDIAVSTVRVLTCLVSCFGFSRRSALRPHPNVVTILGVCMQVDDPFIVSEYLDGGSLANLLLDGSIPISSEVALQMCADIASGVSHVHNEGILHCDLASRNVLVSPKKNGTYTVKVRFRELKLICFPAHFFLFLA